MIRTAHRPAANKKGLPGGSEVPYLEQGAGRSPLPYDTPEFCAGPRVQPAVRPAVTSALQPAESAYDIPRDHEQDPCVDRDVHGRHEHRFLFKGEVLGDTHKVRCSHQQRPQAQHVYCGS